jgi:hypothetical protein
MTADDWCAFLFLYAFVSFIVGLFAVLSAVDAYHEWEKRKAARIALTCWAWPVYLALVTGRGLVWLVRAAL